MSLNQNDVNNLINFIQTSMDDLVDEIDQELDNSANLCVQMINAKTPVVTGKMRNNTRKIRHARGNFSIINDVKDEKGHYYGPSVVAAHQAKGNDFWYGEGSKALQIAQQRIRQIFMRHLR